MSDIDPFDQPPLYEENQVITLRELYFLREGMLEVADQLHHSSATNVIALDTMIDLIEILIEWINDGKPDKLKLKRGYNEEL